MKKILLTLSAVLATMGAANGQNFVSARMDAPVQAPAAEDDANWMKWCNEGAEFFYQFGAGTNSDFGLGSRFSKEILADYEGKSISLVAIYVAESMKDVSVELKKGDDITTAKDVATKTAPQFAPGWNYVKFDEPVEIDATEAISLVYHAVVSANAFPAALDATPLSATADEGKAYCYYEGGFDDLATFTTSQGQRPYADLGHPVMKLFIGEDDQYLALNATMDMYNYVDRYVPNGEECDITVMFSNASFTTIDNVTLACEINGEKTEETITFSPALAANSMTQHSFKYTADKDYDISYSIAQINGETYSNEMNIPLNYAIQPYDASKTVDRTILIEKFTGQDCGFCPGGEQSIQAAIKGHEDRVARIDHHAGYYPDIFTISESEDITSDFGVTGAPSCMVNRRYEESQGAVAWHPGYMTADMVENYLARPGFTTLEINDTFDAENRELTVTVKGEGAVDLQGKRITVAITQSGYKARQASGGNNWLHNDFPIVFLTEYNGDALNVNEDNTFEMTFKSVINENYFNRQGSFTVDMNQLKVVAFINDWNYLYDNQVLNAAFKTASCKGAVESTKADGLTLYAADGKIMADKDCTIEVYNLTGAQVENESLERGLYIVKAVADGKTYTQKLTVR